MDSKAQPTVTFTIPILWCCGPCRRDPRSQGSAADGRGAGTAAPGGCNSISAAAVSSTGGGTYTATLGRDTAPCLMVDLYTFHSMTQYNLQ
jgi:hypothetical protein